MEDKKVYGRFVIDFFDDGGVGLGIKDYKYISEEAPDEIKKSIRTMFNYLKDYPELIIRNSKKIDVQWGTRW